MSNLLVEQFNKQIETDNPITKILHEFKILHEGWELDNAGWVVELYDEEKKIVLTNHGQPYFASPKELSKKCEEYKLLLKEAAKAIHMVL